MVQMAPSTETSVFLASRGKTTKLPVLVDGVADPVHSGVVSDGIVEWVDEDDFVILVS